MYLVVHVMPIRPTVDALRYVQVLSPRQFYHIIRGLCCMYIVPTQLCQPSPNVVGFCQFADGLLPYLIPTKHDIVNFPV